MFWLILNKSVHSLYKMCEWGGEGKRERGERGERRGERGEEKGDGEREE